MDILDIINEKIKIPNTNQFDVNKLMGGYINYNLQSPGFIQGVSLDFIINTIELFDDSLIDMLTTYIRMDDDFNNILTQVEIEKIKTILVEPDSKIQTKIEYDELIKTNTEVRDILEKIYKTPKMTEYLVMNIISNPEYISFTDNGETIEYLNNYIESYITNNSYTQDNINTVSIINSVVSSYDDIQIENINEFNESLKSYINNIIENKIEFSDNQTTDENFINNEYKNIQSQNYLDVNNFNTTDNNINILNSDNIFDVKNNINILNSDNIFDVKNNIKNPDLSKTNISNEKTDIKFINEISNVINNLKTGDNIQLIENYNQNMGGDIFNDGNSQQNIFNNEDTLNISNLNNIFNDSYINSISNIIKEKPIQDVKYDNVMTTIENITNQITNITNQVTDVKEKIIVNKIEEPQNINTGYINNNPKPNSIQTPENVTTEYLTPPQIPRRRLPKFNDIGKY